MIYEPREDSFLLEKVVINETKPNDKVLDMGTGSGIQALAAKKIASDVTAVDINPECINSLQSTQLKLVESNLFDNIAGSFDLIIFNAPYLPRDPNEPEDSALATTGGEKGHEIIEEFLKQAKSHLNNDGRILLLYSSLSGQIKEIAKTLKYGLNIVSEEKMAFETLYVARLTPKIL